MATHIIADHIGRTNYTVDIVPRKSITVTRINEKPVTFEIGDTAEYDSYNLKYLGEIVSITDKTVTIQPPYRGRKTRLKLENFAWRNWDFDAERIARENFETSQNI